MGSEMCIRDSLKMGEKAVDDVLLLKGVLVDRSPISGTSQDISRAEYDTSCSYRSRRRAYLTMMHVFSLMFLDRIEHFARRRC